MATIKPYDQQDEPPDPYATQYGSTGDQPSTQSSNTSIQPYTGPATTDMVPPTHAQLASAGEARPPAPTIEPPNPTASVSDPVQTVSQWTDQDWANAVQAYGSDPRTTDPFSMAAQKLTGVYTQPSLPGTSGIAAVGPGAMITSYLPPKVTDKTPGQTTSGPQPSSPPNTPVLPPKGATPPIVEPGNPTVGVGPGQTAETLPNAGTTTGTAPTPATRPPVAAPNTSPAGTNDVLQRLLAGVNATSGAPKTAGEWTEDDWQHAAAVLGYDPRTRVGYNDAFKLASQAYTPPSGYGALENSTIQAAQNQLSSPSPYNSQAVKDQYNWLAQSIDDDYAQKQRELDNAEAQKGLFGSVGKDFHSGRASDLNVGQRTAKETLARDLANQYATTAGQYQQNAITQGQQTTNAANANALAYIQSLMGYGQNAFNNDLATAQFGQQQNQDEQDYLLKLLQAGYGA